MAAHWANSLCVLLVLFVALTQARVSYEGHVLESFHLTTRTDAKAVVNIVEEFGLDLWAEHVRYPGRVDVMIGPDQLDAVMARADQMELQHITSLADVQEQIDTHLAATAASGAGSNSTFFDTFRTFDEMNSFMSTLASTYPSLCSMFQLGTTLEGRPINGLRITGGSDDASVAFRSTSEASGSGKPGMFLLGGQHAREWLGPMTVAYLADALLSGYSASPEIQNLVNSFEYTVVPIENGDGYNYTWTDDRLWRKNRRQNTENCWGVDNNRNWDVAWGTDGISFVPCSDEYCGPEAFSEPEESAVADYMSAQGNFQGFIDFHAYGQLYMAPYGFSPTATPDADLQLTAGDVASAAIYEVNGLNFTVGPIYSDVYPSSGDSGDWTYVAVDAVYSYGIELRPDHPPGFILLPSNIVPSGQEQMAGLIALNDFMLKNPMPPQTNSKLHPLY